MVTLKRTDYEVLRRRCVELKAQDWPQHRIADALGLSQPWVSRTLKTYRQSGAEALGTHPASGQPPKLTSEQIQVLLDALNQGAESQGFAGQVWTRKRINAVISTLFGVSYDLSQVGRILKKAGWSYQRPALKARQQSAPAVAQWRSQRLPDLKKKLSRKTASSFT